MKTNGRQAILTHVGQRWCTHQLMTLPQYGLPPGLSAGEWRTLLELLRCKVVHLVKGGCPESLIAKGLVEPCENPMDEEALRVRFMRNPLENLKRVSLEFTTECDSNCLHCRNGGQAPLRELHPARLFPAIDLLGELGIDRFDFIGGEVIRFGVGWLEVVHRIRQQPGRCVSVLTSGWFLGQKDIQAAGRKYATDAELLEDLSREGVTHLAFSMDGPRELHDHWRRTPGLYDQLLDGFGKARRAGLQPQVSIIRPEREDPASEPWLADVAQALYAPQLEGPFGDLVLRLLYDENNLVNNLIDIGNATALRVGRRPVSEVEDSLLRCKNFFRPCPTLRLGASGEVTTCPLMGDARGYGNLHQTSLLEILNHIHETPLFRLHAENRLPGFRSLLDPQIFGDRIDHVCSLRVALTRLAVETESRGIDPGDLEAVHRLNGVVARGMGISCGSGSGQ